LFLLSSWIAIQLVHRQSLRRTISN
jgi:hypothetical protein